MNTLALVKLQEGIPSCFIMPGPVGITAVSYTHLDVYKRQPLISFQGKDIVSTFSPDLVCHPLLCSHCINCNYLIFYVYFFQQFRNCCYLVAFFLHCLLPKAKPIFLTPVSYTHLSAISFPEAVQ